MRTEDEIRAIGLMASFERGVPSLDEMESMYRGMESFERGVQLIVAFDRKARNAALEEAARVAREKASFSPMPNPSDLDLGWKRCARAIADEIHALKSKGGGE